MQLNYYNLEEDLLLLIATVMKEMLTFKIASVIRLIEITSGMFHRMKMI